MYVSQDRTCITHLVCLSCQAAASTADTAPCCSLCAAHGCVCLSQAVTKAEVHDIMGQLPVGVAVEQPDGDVNYGAPAQSSAGNTAYVRPAETVPLRQHMSASSAAVV